MCPTHNSRGEGGAGRRGRAHHRFCKQNSQRCTEKPNGQSLHRASKVLIKVELENKDTFLVNCT